MFEIREREEHGHEMEGEGEEGGGYKVYQNKRREKTRFCKKSQSNAFLKVFFKLQYLKYVRYVFIVDADICNNY